MFTSWNSTRRRRGSNTPPLTPPDTHQRGHAPARAGLGGRRPAGSYPVLGPSGLGRSVLKRSGEGVVAAYVEDVAGVA